MLLHLLLPLLLSGVFPVVWTLQPPMSTAAALLSVLTATVKGLLMYFWGSVPGQRGAGGPSRCNPSSDAIQ